MRTRAFKYLSPLIIYVGAMRSFTVTGWEVWIPLIYSWIIIPVTELLLHPDASNLTAAEEDAAKNDKVYDLFLYMIVIMQFVALFYFLYGITSTTLAWYDVVGRVWVMGLLCGTFGINVGHELGHRVNPFEQFLAKMLLLTSLYMHFNIEHNRGHHKHVATPEDPSSARFGENVYAFYFRSIVFSYFSAWRIAADEMRKKNAQVISLKNEMIQFHIVQLVFIASVFFYFGWFATICFLIAAGIGIGLLETVNYIEHYGLQRKEIAAGKYERAMPAHSWNSNHIIGRLMLFELSRHSDHHYLASRKYQVLRHHDDSPQMPTGYPGMMLLSMVPPLWFYVMNRRLKSLEENKSLLKITSPSVLNVDSTTFNPAN